MNEADFAIWDSALKTIATVVGTLFAVAAFFARRLDSMITNKVKEQLREAMADITASNSQQLRESVGELREALKEHREQVRDERREDIRGIHERLDALMLRRM